MTGLLIPLADAIGRAEYLLSLHGTGFTDDRDLCRYLKEQLEPSQYQLLVSAYPADTGTWSDALVGAIGAHRYV